jgi:hypothetical protein
MAGEKDGRRVSGLKLFVEKVFVVHQSWLSGRNTTFVCQRSISAGFWETFWVSNCATFVNASVPQF